MKRKLKFGRGNAKLGKKISTFSLPAGKTCPGASLCKSMAIKLPSGKSIIQDGPETKFRCFAASTEVLYDNTFESRKYNLDLLKSAKSETKMADLIISSLPKTDLNRIHVSGDFYKKDYFKAWTLAIKENPHKLFYAYTKSLNIWTSLIETVPDNLILTASVGGKWDHLIDKFNLKYAKVVFSEEEAASLGLEIDHDDSLAMVPGVNFALLLHGTQPRGSAAAASWKKIKETVGGYSKKHKRLPVVNK